MRRDRHRPTSWVAAGLVVVVALVVANPAGAVGGASSTLSVDRTADGSLAEVPTARACPPCEVPAVTPHAAAIGWQNVTAEQLGNLPPATYGSSLAYDDALHEAVWFGGCGFYACPSNATWVYANSTWTDLSATLSTAPFPEYSGSATYDPDRQVVVETGGIVISQGSYKATNATWEFGASGWSRVAPSCSGPLSPTNACLPAAAFASFANDPTFSSTSPAGRDVRFGGCLTAICLARNGSTPLSNATYVFNASSGTWGYLASTPTSTPFARGGAAMAYDPAAGGLVLFGGVGLCGLSSCTLNDTWLFANGSWTDVTSTFSPTGDPVPARAFGAMTWDPALSELLLVGGQIPGSGIFINDTEALRCSGAGSCRWASVPSAVPPVTVAPAFTADVLAAPTNSSALHPLLVGGEPPITPLTNATWVFSDVPALNVAVAPAPLSSGHPVYLNATAVGSVSPTFAFAWGDGPVVRTSDGHGTHVYALAGGYNVTVAVIDPNGSANLHQLQLLVTPAPAAVVTARYSTVWAGVLDTFTATPVPGTGAPPFNYTWNFGTGQPEYGPNASFSFSQPGNFTVAVFVRDSHGESSSTNFLVDVVPPLSVLIQNPRTISPLGIPSVGPRFQPEVPVDAGVPADLEALVFGGAGPYNITWSFADGSTAEGPGVVRTWSEPGNQTLRVEVVDASGESVESNVTIVVESAVAVQIHLGTSRPAVGASIEFVSQATGGWEGPNVSWTFGDGSHVLNSADATHVYASAGTYTVTVWANDSLGSSATNSTQVVVVPAGGLASILLSPLVLAGAAGVVVLLLIVPLVVRRRRRRPPAEPTDP